MPNLGSVGGVGVEGMISGVRQSWRTCVRLEERLACMGLQCENPIERCCNFIALTVALFEFLRGSPPNGRAKWRTPLFPSQSESTKKVPLSMHGKIALAIEHHQTPITSTLNSLRQVR